MFSHKLTIANVTHFNKSPIGFHSTLMYLLFSTTSLQHQLIEIFKKHVQSAFFATLVSICSLSAFLLWSAYIKWKYTFKVNHCILGYLISIVWTTILFIKVIADPDERILVMGATNRPQELDDAALRYSTVITLLKCTCTWRSFSFWFRLTRTSYCFNCFRRLVKRVYIPLPEKQVSCCWCFYWVRDSVAVFWLLR